VSDELFIDARDLIRFLARRRVLMALEVACLLPVSWCRQQQLLHHRGYLRHSLEVTVLSLLAKNFRLRSHVGLHLARKRTPAARRR
jgi:hypothetical protein